MDIIYPDGVGDWYESQSHLGYLAYSRIHVGDIMSMLGFNL